MLELMAVDTAKFFVAAKLLMLEKHTSNRTSVVPVMADLNRD